MTLSMGPAHPRFAAGEMLQAAEPLLEKNLHPTVIVRGYIKAMEDAIAVVDKVSFPIDTNDSALPLRSTLGRVFHACGAARGGLSRSRCAVASGQQMLNIVNSCIGTKFTTRFGPLMAELALEAVMTVSVLRPDGKRDIDIKKYAKVEKIAGGAVEDCRVLKGVMFNKDVVSPSRMRRHIANPRILLLDCPLEYKKGESQTNVEISKEEDWATLLKMEEEWIEGVCKQIISFKPDVVITEKGLSDLAAHFLAKADISAIRRIRKTDNNRIARATGATIVSRPEEIREADIGTGAGVFKARALCPGAARAHGGCSRVPPFRAAG